MTVRVLVADDQALVRAGFGALLAAQDDIDVVGEAADGEQAVELARGYAPTSCSWTSACPARRPRRHPAHRRRRRAGRRARRHPHDVRARRVRLRGAAGRGQRVPRQGHRAGRAAPRGAGGRRRRGAAVAERDAAPHRRVRRPAPSRRPRRRQRSTRSPNGSARCSRWWRGLTNDEIAERLVMSPRDGEDPREPGDRQAGGARPGAARRAGVRVRAGAAGLDSREPTTPGCVAASPRAGRCGRVVTAVSMGGMSNLELSSNLPSAPYTDRARAAGRYIGPPPLAPQRLTPCSSSPASSWVHPRAPSAVRTPRPASSRRHGGSRGGHPVGGVPPGGLRRNAGVATAAVAARPLPDAGWPARHGPLGGYGAECSRLGPRDVVGDRGGRCGRGRGREDSTLLAFATADRDTSRSSACSLAASRPDVPGQARPALGRAARDRTGVPAELALLSLGTSVSVRCCRWPASPDALGCRRGRGFAVPRRRAAASLAQRDERVRPFPSDARSSRPARQALDYLDRCVTIR